MGIQSIKIDPNVFLNVKNAWVILNTFIFMDKYLASKRIQLLRKYTFSYWFSKVTNQVRQDIMKMKLEIFIFEIHNKLTK